MKIAVRTLYEPNFFSLHFGVRSVRTKKFGCPKFGCPNFKKNSDTRTFSYGRTDKIGYFEMSGSVDTFRLKIGLFTFEATAPSISKVAGYLLVHSEGLEACFSTISNTRGKLRSRIRTQISRIYTNALNFHRLC